MPSHSSFRSNLLRWYSSAKRTLPWRGNKNPYLVWLSEVIMQQTRVEQGTPYYLKYVEKYPTLVDLANAPDDEVMKLWQGLGYYSRARNMLTAARQVRDAFGGKFPNDYTSIRKLKGVGDYTAAAIASISFGLPHAVVDGNVLRVLARYFGEETPIDLTAGKKLYSRLAEELLDKKHPAEFNQAMMELGSLVCKPRSPLCAECPVSAGCQALQKNLQEKLPIKAGKTAVRNRHFHYLVFTTKGQTLLRKRPSGDIWQGLYEFPLLEGELSEQQIIEEANKWCNGGIVLSGISHRFQHILSHQKLWAKFYELETEALLPPNDYVVVDWNDFENYPVSRLTEKWWENKDRK